MAEKTKQDVQVLKGTDEIFCIEYGKWDVICSQCKCRECWYIDGFEENVGCSDQFKKKNIHCKDMSEDKEENFYINQVEKWNFDKWNLIE